MAKLFDDAVAAVGRPDIAINTVGKVLKKPILETTEAEYDGMSDGWWITGQTILINGGYTTK